MNKRLKRDLPKENIQIDIFFNVQLYQPSGKLSLSQNEIPGHIYQNDEKERKYQNTGKQKIIVKISINGVLQHSCWEYI